MNKVIKITEDEIFIGRDDGSVLTTEKANASWDVQVGDEVEVFASGETVILNLAKPNKRNKSSKLMNNAFVNKIVSLSQKIFPIVFSCLFVLFLVALIVVSCVPRGSKYTFKDEIAGIEISSVVEFTKDELTSTTYYSESLEDENMIYTTNYKITDGKLYTYNLTTKEYNYAGKISSTKAIIESEGLKIEYKENTMIALQTLSIVFMVIFAVLDLASITILVLTKKGIIKSNQNS